MANQIIEELEKSQAKNDVPHIRVGDKVRVSKIIIEGKKKRTQRFEGAVIKRTGRFSRESITVRRVIDQIGVEKTFLVHSPTVPKIEVMAKGKARQARLYYLRDRVGSKAIRLKKRA